jgi:hypothetical protein
MRGRALQLKDMSYRAAALYLFVFALGIAPFKVALALGSAADAMCNPYFEQCPCNQIPDKKDPKKCVPGGLKSNTHGCDVGICEDTTNGHHVTGWCVTANKCEAVFCDGKTCEEAVPGGSTQGTTQNTGTTPTTDSTGTNIPTVGDTNTGPNLASPGETGSQPGETQTSGVKDPWQDILFNPTPISEQPPPLSGGATGGETGADKIPDILSPQSNANQNQISLTPVAETTNFNDRYGSFDSSNLPSWVSPYMQDTTGFNSPSASAEGGFWSEVGQSVENLGTEVNNAVNGLTDYYNSNEFANTLNKGGDFIDNIRSWYGENTSDYKFTDTANLSAYGVCEGMASGCNAMEGPPTTAVSHLDENGKPTNQIYTLNDYADGKVPYVTTASSPDRFGETGVLDQVKFTDPATGETKTLTNVPYVVADTGGEFQNGTSKMDVPLTVPAQYYGNTTAINGILDTQPFSGTQVAIAETNGIAPPDYSSQGNAIAALNGSQGLGFGGSSIASLDNYPSLGSSQSLSEGLSGQNTELTSGALWDLPQSGTQSLENLPLPEPLQNSPQENIWNDIVQNAQKSSAENLNSFYDSVSSVFNPSNQDFENSLLESRLAQADQETAQYQADLLSAESKIPVPEMTQVSGEDITKQVVDNNVPVPETVATNPQQSVEDANKAALDSQMNAAQQTAEENAAHPTPSQIEEQVRQANIAEGKYTLSNAGDLRGEFLSDPLTAALIPDSMKEKILSANESGAENVTFSKQELDSIHWDLANANQATKLENILGDAGYERSDGFSNDRPAGVADVAILQQLAQERQGGWTDISSQPTELTSGPLPESQASLEKTADEINREFIAAQQPSWFGMAQEIANGTLGADTPISEAQQQAINAANEEAQLQARLSEADQENAQTLNQLVPTDLGPASEPIQNPPLPQERPNILSYDSQSDIGKYGVDGLVKELPSTKDLPAAAQAQAADAIRNALVDNPDTLKQLGATGIKNGDVVFPDKGTLNLSALNNPDFQKDLSDNIRSDERVLTTQLGGNDKVDSFAGSVAQNNAAQGIQDIAKGDLGSNSITKEIIAEGTQSSETNSEEKPIENPPLPKPRPTDIDQASSQDAKAQADAAAEAQAQAKRDSSISSLLKNSATASKGVEALANAGFMGSDQQAMRAGAQAAARMQSLAASIGDTQLSSQINKYLGLQSQMTQLYNANDYFSLWPLKNQAVTLGRSIVNSISNKYGQ